VVLAPVLGVVACVVVVVHATVMVRARRVMASTFGVLAGLAGIEHGIGETLQGNVAPDGMMILSRALALVLANPGLV